MINRLILKPEHRAVAKDFYLSSSGRAEEDMHSQRQFMGLNSSVTWGSHVS